MNVSPVFINTMLEIFYRADIDHSWTQSSPARIEAIERLKRERLIKLNPDRVEIPSVYVVTVRGQAYVEFLCNMPFPISKWVMPDRDCGA